MSKKRSTKIPQATMENMATSLGPHLRAARTRANMTEAELHAKTRVPLETIMALEAEDFSALPAMVYTRGFIKLICTELGLSYDQTVALLPTLMQEPSRAALSLMELSQQMNHASSVSDKDEEKQSPVSTALVLFILVVLASLAISYFASQKEREQQHTPSASEVHHLDVTG